MAPKAHASYGGSEPDSMETLNTAPLRSRWPIFRSGHNPSMIVSSVTLSTLRGETIGELNGRESVVTCLANQITSIAMEWLSRYPALTHRVSLQRFEKPVSRSKLADNPQKVS